MPFYCSSRLKHTDTLGIMQVACVYVLVCVFLCACVRTNISVYVRERGREENGVLHHWIAGSLSGFAQVLTWTWCPLSLAPHTLFLTITHKIETSQARRRTTLVLSH